jgi:hypothetical protein
MLKNAPTHVSSAKEIQNQLEALILRLPDAYRFGQVQENQ